MSLCHLYSCCFTQLFLRGLKPSGDNYTSYYVLHANVIQKKKDLWHFNHQEKHSQLSASSSSICMFIHTRIGEHGETYVSVDSAHGKCEVCEVSSQLSLLIGCM